VCDGLKEVLGVPGLHHPASVHEVATVVGSSDAPWPGSPATARLTLRYERRARLFTALLTFAATLTCYKELAT
jgi:hypothetical protein